MTDKRYRILLLDDDRDLLDLYKEILSQLPSKPEVVTSQTGRRAMTLLESEPFAMLICDLNMPKMDGLQVLSIVRRKYPQLRTVVLTAVPDEQFRSRVYALGVDLYWQKPSSQAEIKMFVECLESLLGRDEQQLFRGVQNKNLVDIIQLECISQNSTVLKITNGPFTGKIWIENGELIDAVAENLEGEPAFQKILSWKTGAFEYLAAEPGKERKIFKSYNALLLETAQAFDEAKQDSAGKTGTENAASTLETVTQMEGVEFAVKLESSGSNCESRGLENSAVVSQWAIQTLGSFRELGDQLRVGSLEQIEGVGPQRNVALGGESGSQFCVGWTPRVSLTEIREAMKKILALCAS
jgi:CheY-like chemotaxis protein